MFYVSEIRRTAPSAFKTELQRLVYQTLAQLSIPFERVDTQEAVAMEDCVPVLRVMDDGETAFYRDFHQRNLIATIRERLRQTEIA